MRPFFPSGTLVLAASAGLLLAACGGTTASGTGTGTTAASASPSAALVQTQSITVGGSSEMVLKNSAGLTLYYFTPDSASTVACTGQCASLWPPLLSNSDTPTASSSLPGHLTVVAGGNGKQVEYNGHPLYTYSKDSGPSDANGQGLFGKWFVATPSLAMSAVASATPSASKSSTYNPYGG